MPNAPEIYVALLRGINVGGKNIIKMVDLRACFEDAGYEAVTTYIQSGNVIFRTGRTARGLVKRLETMLAEAFDYHASVVLRSKKDMQAVVGRAPKGFGAKPKDYRYDVLFLKAPLTAEEALESVSAKPGVDEAHAGEGVLYFSRLIHKATQSRLARLTSMPVYQRMTIRNWNTTTKLLALMEDSS